MKIRELNRIMTLFIAFSFISLVSCDKEYEDREIIEDTYSGNIFVTSVGQDPAGDFTGTGDSGTYTFAWVNPQSRASANFDITTPTGSVQMIVKDDEGTVVLDKTRSAGGNDTFSGVSESGVSGIWQVTLILTDFKGDGSYSLHPGD
jgi:hypothetical protein